MGERAMSELLEWIERFENARDELEEATREAHSAIKAANQATAELHALHDAIMAEFTDAIDKRANDMLTERLDDFVPIIKDLIDRTARRITSQFGQLEQALFYGRNGEDIRLKAERIVDIAEGVDPNMPNLNRGRRKVDGSSRNPKNRRAK